MLLSAFPYPAFKENILPFLQSFNQHNLIDQIMHAYQYWNLASRGIPSASHRAQVPVFLAPGAQDVNIPYDGPARKGKSFTVSKTSSTAKSKSAPKPTAKEKPAAKPVVRPRTQSQRANIMGKFFFRLSPIFSSYSVLQISFTGPGVQHRKKNDTSFKLVAMFQVPKIILFRVKPTPRLSKLVLAQ